MTVANHPAIDPRAMRAAAGDACALMRVLANPDRLLLLCQLCAGEACVSELEAAVRIRQPTLSQQLGVLRAEGLVATRREGKSIYYRVADPHALAVIELLHGRYCGAPAKKAKKRASA